MQELLQSPPYWLFLTICASSDYLKMLPLLAIYNLGERQDRYENLEFIALALGDISLLGVTSFDNYVALNIGVFAFLVFVWSRLIDEIITFNPVRGWPIPALLTVAYFVVAYHPIEQLLLQTYVFSLALLLALRYCQDNQQELTLGYSLYIISDCLLLFSLGYRFWGDWMLVRLLYWSGLTCIYSS